MRALVQRVLQAEVVVQNKICGEIKNGLLVFLGVESADDEKEADWLSEKITGLRIFPDSKGLMNCSVKETGGDILLISQFTLCAGTKKGKRPSFAKAADPEKANILYQSFQKKLSEKIGKSVPTGVFGAHMRVELVNDGPVTIWIDSLNRE